MRVADLQFVNFCFELLQLLLKLLADSSSSGMDNSSASHGHRSHVPVTVVYVSRREEAEALSDYINNTSSSSSSSSGRTRLKSAFYHAGMSTQERAYIQKQFLLATNPQTQTGNNSVVGGSQTRILVATIAFGLGIDKADIRHIIHYNTPQTIENYVQECGRAGGCFVMCMSLCVISDVCFWPK